MDLRAPLKIGMRKCGGYQRVCVALDLPGHGGSAMPATVSIATMAEAVNTVKNQIGSRRAILIGHSMGCRVINGSFSTISELRCMKSGYDVVGPQSGAKRTLIHQPQ
jgi:hypothetical protein